LVLQPALSDVKIGPARTCGNRLKYGYTYGLFMNNKISYLLMKKRRPYAHMHLQPYSKSKLELN